MVLSESSQAQKAQVVWFHCYGASSLDKCVQPESKAVVTGRWGGAPQVAQQGSICSGDTGDSGLVPGWGRSPGEGNGNPLQYSCLENSMDRGAWRTTVHRVAKSQTRLSSLSLTHSQSLSWIIVVLLHFCFSYNSLKM